MGLHEVVLEKWLRDCVAICRGFLVSRRLLVFRVRAWGQLAPPPSVPAQMQSNGCVGVHLQVRFAGDRCSVCDNDVDYDNDQLISCDQCGITMHQSCYGVAELPGEGVLWLCRTCEFAVWPPRPRFLNLAKI